LKILFNSAERSYVSDLLVTCRGNLNKIWRNIKMLIYGSKVSKFPTEVIHNNIFIFLNVALKLAEKKLNFQLSNMTHFYLVNVKIYYTLIFFTSRFYI